MADAEEEEEASRRNAKVRAAGVAESEEARVGSRWISSRVRWRRAGTPRPRATSARVERNGGMASRDAIVGSERFDDDDDDDDDDDRSPPARFAWGSIARATRWNTTSS